MEFEELSAHVDDAKEHIAEKGQKKLQQANDSSDVVSER